MPKQLGPYIRGLRQQKGLSLASTGRELGYSKSYLSLAERGKREIAPGMLYPLMRILGGDLLYALALLALDAGVPPEELRAIL